ncbi:MAG: hypothetical protein GEU82_17185, partial [Luteitalea sp.]|nr:hypothetical protein [Luteitalea sp.]
MTINVSDAFKTLEQISAVDAAEAGGKAFNCGRLTQAGFAVPPGLVVLASATPDDIDRTVDPDEIHVDKISGAIVLSRPGTGEEEVRLPASDLAGRAGGRPVLDEMAIAELSQLALRIERFFGAPQDIEWCHDGRQFWVLQSRPVTAAPASGANDIEWTRANLIEVFPDQTSPQALAVYEDMLNRAEVRFMGRLIDPALGPMLKSFHGRLYFNLLQLRNICRLGGAAPAGALRSFGHSDAIRPADEVATRPALRDVLPRLPDFIRLARNDRRLPRLMRRQERALEAIIRRFASVR